jgi:hypothetical protein
MCGRRSRPHIYDSHLDHEDDGLDTLAIRLGLNTAIVQANSVAEELFLSSFVTTLFTLGVIDNAETTSIRKF